MALTGSTLAGTIACVLALVVALFGYLEATDLPGVDINLEACSATGPTRSRT